MGLISEKVWMFAFALASLALVALSVEHSKTNLELQKKRTEIAEYQLDVSRAENKLALQKAEAEKQMRAREQELTRAVEEERKKSNERQTAANADRRRLLERLRIAEADAAAGTGIVPSASTAANFGKITSADPGSVLPRGVGDDLVSLSHRAETVRIELVSCYARYERAVEVINSLSVSTTEPTIRE